MKKALFLRVPKSVFLYGIATENMENILRITFHNGLWSSVEINSTGFVSRP